MYVSNLFSIVTRYFLFVEIQIILFRSRMRPRRRLELQLRPRTAASRRFQGSGSSTSSMVSRKRIYKQSENKIFEKLLFAIFETRPLRII